MPLVRNAFPEIEMKFLGSHIYHILGEVIHKIPLQVTLFDGLQYPLTEVSGVHSYPARFNSAVYFKLRFEVQYTSNQLRYHSEDWVNLFRNISVVVYLVPMT